MGASIWSPSAPVGASADSISFAPTATIAATNVQDAIEETDTENRALSAAVRTDLASSDVAKGDALITVLQEGGLARTLHSLLNDWKVVTSYGSIVADGTDQTANFQAWFASIGSSAKGVYIIPYNVKFVRKTITATMPVGLVFLNFSMINDFSAPGETNKHIGILTSDSAPNDTHWSIDSSHHCVLALNNNGVAGSTSGQERKGSIMWISGEFELGSTNKRGYRGIAIEQFTKETGANYWVKTIRGLAPWESVAGDYEYWAQGQSIGALNLYRSSSVGHYKSASTGICGATEPTHTSGTVSDGGVSWTYVGSTDYSIYSVDQFGRWLLGQGSAGATWRHKVNNLDPAGGDYTFQGAATGVSKVALLRLFATDGAGAEVNSPYLRAESSSLRLMKADSSGEVASITDSGGLLLNEIRSNNTNVTSGTTLDAAGVGTIILNYGAPASITALNNGSDNQIVRIVFQSANITLVHSATFMLAGSVNLVTPAAWSFIEFQKIPSAISDRWIETQRSLR